MSRKKLQTIIELQDKYSKELKQFSDDLNKATEELEKLNQKGSTGTDKLGKSFINLSTVVKSVGIGYLSKKIFDLGNFAVGAASKMNELSNVTNQVFQNSKEEIVDWAKSIDNQIGRSIYQMQNFASIYGSMFKGAGFDVSYFKDVSKELAVLTADFSSFFNVTDDEAFTALKGALTGETEALKRYGIILNDTVMSQYALSKGIKGSWVNLDNSIKMQLRYNKLMEMTSFIQGDAARTIDGYANSLKKAEGLIDNIATSVGQKLIPGATGAVHMFNDIAESIEMMLNKKDTSDYLFDFIKEKESITDLKDRYTELSELYLEGLSTPESEKERLDLYQKISALYPGLLDKIGKEASAYDEVAKALDGVIAKLKTKALQEAQSDVWKEGLTKARKYYRQIVDIENKQIEKGLKIDNKYGTNISNTYTHDELKKLSSLMASFEYDKNAKKQFNKLVNEIANKNNIKVDENLIKATKEYAENAELLAVKTGILTKKADEVLKEAEKDVEVLAKTLPKMLEVAEKTSYNNKAYSGSSKSTQEKIDKAQAKSDALDAEKNKDSEEVKKENEEKIKSIKENYKKGIYKTVKDYETILKDLTAIGADPEFTSEISSKLNAMRKEKNKKQPNKKTVSYGDYQSSINVSDMYQKMTGANEESRLKARVSIIKSYIKKAIEEGRKDLLSGLKSDLENTEFGIKKIKINEALDGIKKDLSNLDVDFKKGKISKHAYNQKSYELLDDIIQKYEENRLKLSDIEEKAIAEKIRHIKEQRDVHAKKLVEEEKFINHLKVLNSVASNLTSLGNSISQIGSITGSSTMGGIGSVIGGIGSIAGAMKDWKGLGSITGMFGGGATALSAGMASLGAVAGGLTAAVGIVSTIGSLTGGVKGKKQKAKIDAENKRQLQLYEKNNKNLAKLTEIIENNSKKLETFADKLSDNISKNPTLNRIAKGKGSLINLKDMLVQNKVFGDISAVQKGHTYYKKSFGRVGRTDTYVNRILKDEKLLKYLGFNGNSKSINEQDFYQLLERASTVTTKDINRIYNNHDEITKSNVDVWVKNIQEWGNTIKQLSNADSGLFKGATMGSFFGIDYKSNMQLIKEYKDMLKGIGIDADKEQYKDAIQSMIEGNNVLITSMQDVRSQFIEGFSSGKESSFLNGMKSYFNNIFKNVSSVIYDVGFSDTDEYLNKTYEKIANKLVGIKTSGKLDFSDLFKGFDFKELNSVDLFEKKYKRQIDILKRQMFDSGVDLSIVNKILPTSDFNVKINELEQALNNGMSAGLENHKFESFSESLGKSLYDNTKNSLVKAFSESSLYQGLISKFINFEDMQKQIEEAGTFKKAYELMESKLQIFGYRMEANGFGGFDAINNKVDKDNNLGNAYYQDKASNVNINVTNNFNREVYGLEDFTGIIRKTTQDGIKEFFNKPKVLP